MIRTSVVTCLRGPCACPNLCGHFFDMRCESNKRLLLILATYFQPNSESKFKMLFDVYQLSNSTYFGHKPRSAASLIISVASSTFDLPPFCHSRIETGILR